MTHDQTKAAIQLIHDARNATCYNMTIAIESDLFVVDDASVQYLVLRHHNARGAIVSAQTRQLTPVLADEIVDAHDEIRERTLTGQDAYIQMILAVQRLLKNYGKVVAFDAEDWADAWAGANEDADYDDYLDNEDLFYDAFFDYYLRYEGRYYTPGASSTPREAHTLFINRYIHAKA
jgi:hypothetical protein